MTRAGGLAWLACLLLGVTAVPARAELDARTGEPYRVVLYVQFDEDPIFTRFYRSSVEREVRDQLGNYFGDLARIEIVRIGPGEEHPVKPLSQGGDLADLELSPEEFAECGLEGKLYPIAVDYRTGTYRIRWRQLDADVQYVGPLYSRSTPDRQWLARAICLAVKSDFGPVAVARPVAGTEQVSLAFRGQDRSKRKDGTDRLTAWLGAGGVLTPLRVVQQSDGTTVHMPVQHTALVVAPDGGFGEARTVSSIGQPWRRTGRIAGFRAIRLSTCEGRFRLKLVNFQTGAPVTSVQAFASATAFDPRDENRLGEPDRLGYVVSDRAFQNVVYITLQKRSGGQIKTLLPIVEPWCELECKITIDEEAGRKSQWQRELRYAVQDIKVLSSTIDEHVRAVNELNSEKRYDQAHARVKSALEELSPLIQTAGETVDGMAEEADEIGMGSSQLLAWARTQVDNLRQREGQLTELAGDLLGTIEDLEAQDRAKVLVNLAKQAEEACEFDDAITKLDLALKEWPKLPDVPEHVEELRETWRIKSAEHQAARDFVYGTFAESRVDDVQGLLPEAKRHFRTLQQVGDYLTASKIAKVVNDHVWSVTDITEALSSRSSKDDLAELEKYQKLAEELLAFGTEVADFAAAASREGPRAAPAGGGASPPAALPVKEEPEEEEPPAGPPGPPPGGDAEEEPPLGGGGPPLDEGEEEEPPLEE